jgi:hypothetical protein
MLHLFDDLLLDKIIPKNNDRYRAIYGNLENKINTPYPPLKNSIHKNNDADDKRPVTKRCRRKITEGQWVALKFV